MKKNRVALAALLTMALLITGLGLSGAAAAGEGERIELTMGGNNFTFNIDRPFWPTEFHTWMEDRLNITLTLRNYDLDQTNLALASGDLPDLFMASRAQVILDGGLAVAFDDYIDEYMPNINNYPVRNDFIRKYMSNGDGKLYFHTPNSGGEDVTAGIENWNGYLVRWDLYQAIGAPEINSDDDYIAVMKQMRDIYPRTEDGLPVYGIGVHNDWGLWGWMMHAVPNGGYSNMSTGWAYYTSTRDDAAEIFEMYVNDESPFYQNMAFYNKLNKEGLLDPDSFILSWDEVEAKAVNKQYVGGYCMWVLSKLYNEERKADPETMVGFVPLPGEGLSGWYGQDALIGWGDKLLFVNSKSDHIVKAISFIDMMDDPEVNRTHYSGIQGKYWDYVNGEPKLFESTIALRSAGGDEWDKIGINSWSNFIGGSAFGAAPDGDFFTLWDDVEIKKASLSPLQKNFCEFYGVDYPSQKTYLMAREGKAYNQSKSLHTTVMAGIAAVPTDIERIDGKVNEIVSRAIPGFVNAADDAEFAAAKEKLISDIKAAGYDESWSWWEAEWNEVRAFVKSIVN